MTEIRPAEPADVDRATRTLARAFADYPFTRHTVDARDHLRRVEELQRLYLTEIGLRCGRVWVADDASAVAVWTTPSPPESQRLSNASSDASPSCPVIGPTRRRPRRRRWRHCGPSDRCGSSRPSPWIRTGRAGAWAARSSNPDSGKPAKRGARVPGDVVGAERRVLPQARFRRRRFRDPARRRAAHVGDGPQPYAVGGGVSSRRRGPRRVTLEHDVHHLSRMESGINPETVHLSCRGPASSEFRAGHSRIALNG